MAYVLVLNSGSSSVKFQLVDPEGTATDAPLVSGLVEQVGEPMGAVTVKTGGEEYKEELEIPTHSFGLERAFDIMHQHNVGPMDVEVVAVGHRVVHGGRLFSDPQLITDQIESMIEDLIPLAPLHNPANLDGIRVARKMLPNIP
ncbi:acetate kinase, partial [Corynebacterium striatum]